MGNLATYNVIRNTVLPYALCAGVFSGGSLNNGTNAGFAYLNGNNAASNRNANIGSHLSLYNKNSEQYGKTMALAKTQNNTQCDVGSHRRKLCYVQENMKRYSNLFEQICSPDNIELAYRQARKGKRHYVEVGRIESEQEKYFSELRQMLLSGTYKNSSYEVITRNTGRKIRKIYKLPFFPDRVIHHCLIQVLSPIWMKLFIRDTYATIPGRGIHDGAKRVKNALCDIEGTQYCLKIDVKKYYPSVNNKILKGIIARKIKCKKTLALLAEIIDSTQGIPIGNYTSQWLGNLYLAYFDHFVKEQLHVKYYFRYADDMVFLSGSKEKLWDVFRKTKNYLTNELYLNIKENYQIFPVDLRGLDFLGYRFFHGYTLVRKGIVKNFKRKIKEKTTPQTQPAYWGWFKHADTHNLISRYFDMRKFSDFADEKAALEGEKIKLDDVLNRPVEVLQYRVLTGKYETEKCLQVQIRIDGQLKVIFTGSKILLEQLEKYHNQLPFESTIIRPHRYYSFS